MTFPDEALRELASLAGVVLGQEDLSSTLDEITRIAVRAVPAAEGASVTSTRDGRVVTAAASDDWARSLDELQYVEHEGPCLDCWRTGTVFRVRDLAADSRWPTYGPGAVALGARSSLSFPMSTEGKVVGALNMYSRTPDAFDSQDVAIGELIGAHAGMATQVAAAFFGQRELGDQLRQAMESRAVIEQAKGILMVQHKVSAGEAFDLLRNASQTRNVKLREVAREVTETGELRER